MGCWDETCALTRLNIRAGDDVLAVLVHDDVWGSTYSLGQRIHMHNSMKEHVIGIRTRLREIAESASDTTGLKAFVDTMEDSGALKDVWAGVGKYDDYGWIETDWPDAPSDRPDNACVKGGRASYFLVRLDAVKLLLSIDEITPANVFDVLQKLLGKASWCRIELFSQVNPVGEQHFSRETYAEQVKLETVTHKLREDMMAQYDADYGEWPDEDEEDEEDDDESTSCPDCGDPVEIEGNLCDLCEEAREREEKDGS